MHNIMHCQEKREREDGENDVWAAKKNECHDDACHKKEDRQWKSFVIGTAGIVMKRIQVTR